MTGPADGEGDLDPRDWDPLRALGHRMLDDMIDSIAQLREEPVWQPMPDAVRHSWHEPLPDAPTPLEEVYVEFLRRTAPYSSGNRHPAFMGWVQGGGTAIGMLADMLAAGLNANLGGRDHAPIACERQVIRWAAQMLGFPDQASGLLVTGTSMANMMAVLVARRARLGSGVRRSGAGQAHLTAYASAAVHGCVARAMDFVGLGSDALRLVPGDAEGRIDVARLRDCLVQDRANGFAPFLLVGTAGTVDTGAVDDLGTLAEISASEKLWFHVDAAYGAAAMLSDRLRPLLAGIERADSVAFDFHKWFQVPYDAGCLVVRDEAAHRAAFERPAAYLSREDRGLAGGEFWPCDYGPDLSRGFRALKVWMTIRSYGTDRLAMVVEQTCDLAAYVAARIEQEPLLDLVAPVRLNIVCFRHRLVYDRAHAEIVADLQEAGIAAPSTTTIAGRTVIRAAIVNHRTLREDVDALVDGVLRAAARCCGSTGPDRTDARAVLVD